jgi:bifunctional non-homologous end joining protein LigD
VVWRDRHTTEAVVIGVIGAAPAAQTQVLVGPKGGCMQAVGVSLPLAQQMRLAVAPLLRAAGRQMQEVRGTVGGLPGADPVRFLPVKPLTVPARRSRGGRNPQFVPLTIIDYAWAVVFC